MVSNKNFFLEKKILSPKIYGYSDSSPQLEGLIKIGYSYDINLSRLYIASSGSHEISIQFNFQCQNKNNIKQALSCPSF